MRLKLVPQETNVNFMGIQSICLALSAAAVVASIVLYFVMGLNFGIDFRGGSMLMVETPQPVAIADYRGTLGNLNLGDLSVTEISDPASDLTGTAKNIAMIRIEQMNDDPTIQNEGIEQAKAALSERFPDIQFLSTESVGAKVSGELVQAGILAVLLSVVAVLFYIWLRFEWQFSLGAVIALVHDVTLTIGIFAIFQLEFNLAIIAAILTIVGYSLNDTVIVFDRVRENLRRFKKTPLDEVLNLSINETLSRTVMTSFTTLIALFALYIFGGDVIRGFVFAMIWGIVVGTYSSVFVASPILLRLGVDRDMDKKDGKAGTQFADIDA